MNVIKSFVQDSIMSNPSRYAKDRGDLNLINDFFEAQGWQTLTIEQHKAIAGILRRRNDFLKEHEEFDLRNDTKASPYIQLSIYDMLEREDSTQLKKLVRYWTADPTRLQQSNSRTKKSVRGVDDEHIITSKVMLPVLNINPKVKIRRQNKSPIDGNKNDVLIPNVETNKSA